MMFFVFVVLPAIASAQISLMLNVEVKQYTGIESKVEASAKEVSFSGNDSHFISDDEFGTFHLNTDVLKNAVDLHFGKRPSNVYLLGTANEEDPYQFYHWEQVRTTLAPLSNKVLNISTERVHIHRMVFENTGPLPVPLNVGTSHIVQNTASSSWRTEKFSTKQLMRFGVKMQLADGGKEHSFFFNAQWGKNTQHSENVTVGVTSHMGHTLDPGQAVVSNLYATRCDIRMQLEYEATLVGQIAAAYTDAYEGSNFWAIDIGQCLNTSGHNNHIISQEVIDFQIYAGSELVVTHKNNGSLLMIVTL